MYTKGGGVPNGNSFFVLSFKGLARFYQTVYRSCTCRKVCQPLSEDGGGSEAHFFTRESFFVYSSNYQIGVALALLSSKLFRNRMSLMQFHSNKMNRAVKITLGLALTLGTKAYLSRPPSSKPLLVIESKVKIKKPLSFHSSENDFPQVKNFEMKTSGQAPSSQGFTSASGGGGYAIGGSSDIYGSSGGASFPGYFGAGKPSDPGGGERGTTNYKIYKLKEKEEALPSENSKTSLASTTAPSVGGFGGGPVGGPNNGQGGAAAGTAQASKAKTSDFLEMGKAPEKNEAPAAEITTAEAPESDTLNPLLVASATPAAAKESSSSKTDLSSLFEAPASEKTSSNGWGSPAQQQAQAPAPQESGGDEGGGQQPQAPMMPPPSDRKGGAQNAKDLANASAEDAARKAEEEDRKAEEAWRRGDYATAKKHLDKRDKLLGQKAASDASRGANWLAEAALNAGAIDPTTYFQSTGGGY